MRKNGSKPSQSPEELERLLAEMPELDTAVTNAATPIQPARRRDRPAAAADNAVSRHLSLLRRHFMVGYVLMFTADWLQGPYTYAIYFSRAQLADEYISFLYMVGFLSSALFGSVVGRLADVAGRRSVAITCHGVASLLSCTCLHSTRFPDLVAGRILSGLSSATLHSAYESWLVSAYRQTASVDASAVPSPPPRPCCTVRLPRCQWIHHRPHRRPHRFQNRPGTPLRTRDFPAARPARAGRSPAAQNPDWPRTNGSCRPLLSCRATEVARRSLQRPCRAR